MEAVAALEPSDRTNRHEPAGCLIDLGRTTEALAHLRHTGPPPPLTPTARLWADVLPT
ncbi:hypothetical protein [Streptomyces sp. XY431]|uniref:hypothetical protein n=1 Tax=Streptomyces sp. XY431 TaxID=1415562 RepID=UPI0013313F09|nr:hypothetical protein [Streptomyces sp. XY431]